MPRSKRKLLQGFLCILIFDIYNFITMRSDALKIFTAAVRAVQPQHLLPSHMRWHGKNLQLGEQVFEAGTFDKLFVTGAGKASAAMAREAELILGSHIHEGIIV